MESQITLTNVAIEATRAFREKNPGWIGLDLRVYLSGKGCDGFEYGVTFDESTSGDLIVRITDDINVVCDDKSLEFLIGSTVDWIDDDRGQGFIVNNPNHKKYRGKFYKRASWKQRQPNVSDDVQSESSVPIGQSLLQ